MFKNKADDKKNNCCGVNVKRLRLAMSPKVSQRQFAEMLCEKGFEIDKNGVQRIESGARFVTDVELRHLVKALGVTYAELLDGDWQ